MRGGAESVALWLESLDGGLVSSSRPPLVLLSYPLPFFPTPRRRIITQNHLIRWTVVVESMEKFQAFGKNLRYKLASATPPIIVSQFSCRVAAC